MTAKHAGGRPTKLTPDAIAKAREYIALCNDEYEVVGDKSPMLVRHVNLPKVAGLAQHLGITRSTVYEWQKDSDEFSDIVEGLLAVQEARLVDNSLGGQYNASIAKLMLSKHGYVEKQETDITTNGESINGDPAVAARFTDFLKADTRDDGSD